MAADPPSSDQLGRLASARASFVSNLGRRLLALNVALSELRVEPASKTRLTYLLRRIHALGAAARVLGFGGMAEALSRIEAGLHAALDAGSVDAAVLAEVERLLAGLPGMIWGGPEPAELRAGQRHFPVSVLVAAPLALKEALEEGRSGSLEVEYAESLEHAHELARVIGPDVLVLDADIPGAHGLLERLHQDDMVLPLAMVVIGSFETSQAASQYLRFGVAKLLSKPVTPGLLREAVLELGARRGDLSAPRTGLGPLSVEALAERIAAEIRSGLVDAAQGSARSSVIDLGDGADVLAAVWGAVARVRDLVTAHSAGAVRFTLEGPEGAVPLAPWSGSERRAGDRSGRTTRGADDVSLGGRKILVADDDPAVVWFMSSLLRAAGAEVIEAHDGQSALDLAFAHWPDALVSDVLMPRLDGFSLCREIKRDVAVRDVPVILLSWKEDLLQRMRELGADADGYLRKEASGSTVVERIREVLRPRARVEARLRAGGEVRGRLDGLTPRLVLQLACASGSDLKVTIRDAAYLYVVQIRGGKPSSASRTAPDGKHETGQRALASLLGASAGRFVVLPDASQVEPEFQGTLPDVLREPIERARAAQLTLGPDQVARACSLELDLPLFEGYLDATPEPVRGLLLRLSRGDSPRELLLMGDISARLLELVLGDLARHGAVRRVEDIQGKDLLPEAFERLALRARAARGPVPEPPAEPEEAAGAADPAPERVVLSEPRDPSSVWEPVRVVPVAPDWPMNPDMTPLAAPTGNAGFPPVELGTMPGIGRDAPVEPKDELDSSAAVVAAAELAAGGAQARVPELTLAEAGAALSESDAAPEAKSESAAEPESEPAPEPGPERSAVQRESTPALDIFQIESAPSAPRAAAEPDPDPLPVRRIELPQPGAEPAAPTDRPSDVQEADQVTPHPTTAQAPERDPRLVWGWVRFVAITAAAGVAAFFGVRALLGPAASELPPANAAVAIAEVAPTTPLTPEELDLPEDMPLPTGKALLEIETGGPHAIYVDGQFVGNGPLRRVPIDAGRHEVRTVRGERERSDTVTLKPGRRLRLPLAPAWSSSPAPR